MQKNEAHITPPKLKPTSITLRLGQTFAQEAFTPS